MVCDNGSGEIHLGYLIFVCEDVMSKNCTKLISMVICGGAVFLWVHVVLHMYVCGSYLVVYSLKCPLRWTYPRNTFRPYSKMYSWCASLHHERESMYYSVCNPAFNIFNFEIIIATHRTNIPLS